MITLPEATEVTCIQATDSDQYRNRKVYMIEGKQGFFRIDQGEHTGLQPSADDVAMVGGTMRRMVAFKALNTLVVEQVDQANAA